MDSPRVKIYTEDVSPRLEYISKLIVGEILGLPHEIVTDRRKVGNNPLINYSDKSINGSLQVVPSGLLKETGLRMIDPAVTEWNGMPVFFQSGQESDIPFDIFSASFYLVTRYEEYTGDEYDQHGRYKASSSLAFRYNFLRKPVVDMWIREFARRLVRRFPRLAVRRNYFNALLTIDTDEPFAYLGKNILNSMGSLLRDMASGTANATERYKVVRHEKDDPYQVFNYMLKVIDDSGSQTIFFFPVGERSKFDQNPSWRNSEYRKLITRLVSGHQAGLHPSYFASQEVSLLSKEHGHLEEILGNEVTKSRFHYLRIFYPRSYRNLINQGIKEDYSMGYPDEPGFRAGIARPFSFYDIEAERETGLRIIPLQVMDSSLITYLELSPADAENVISELIQETRSVGGLFVSLWHNTSLLDDDKHSGWRRLFEKVAAEHPA